MAAVHERLVSNDDDFVMTLSDNEATRSNSKEPSEDAKVPKSIAQKPSQKRKRASEKRSNGAYNSTKRQKSIAAGPDIVLQEESVEVTTHGEDDGAMNSDFEFQTAETGTGVIEDFDGWGIGQHLDRNGTNGDKKGVDIDELIARRRAKDPSAADSDGLIMEERNHSTKSTVKADEEPENADAWVEMMRDDELLAEDGFGMGTLNEEEEDDDGLSERDGSAKSDSDQGDDSEGSDNDSVAAAVPHPDDEVSDTSSVAEDRHDLIEKARREAFFAIEEPAANADKSSRAHKAVSFQSMSLSRPVLRGLAAVGFTIPTAIQTKAIPIALLGKDVVGGAVTGSGKTAAFLVPILERLLYRPKKVSTSRVAILMPTRELAVQCYNVAVKLAAFTDITFCCLVGGFSLREQEKELRKRPDVIMATPGRFIDHIRNSLSFTIDTLEILVLDEADRMLEDGFADELNEILTTIPKSRQTLLFSATMTDSVDKLIRVGMDRPVRLLLDARKQTVGTLVQEFVRLRPGREEKRLGYLMLLCNNVYTDRVIIFFRQKKEAHRVRIVFGLCGLKAAELHGSMTQEQRISSVELFRDGKVSFLLATDLASRGLDIKGVETVINYEAPQSHEIYLHRVGRTARAGRAGRACTIAAEPDRKVVKAAVRAGKAQGAKVLSRVVDPEEADNWAKKVNRIEEEINDILREEKEEKQLSQAEMQVKRGENIIVHESEILARPKRTWFESEKDKRAAKKAGMAELNGPEGVVGKKEKKKLSNKDKKRLDDKDMRTEGKMWKKGKADRVGKKVVTRKKGGKAAPRSFKKGKSGNR